MAETGTAVGRGEEEVEKEKVGRPNGGGGEEEEERRLTD